MTNDQKTPQKPTHDPLNALLQRHLSAATPADDAAAARILRKLAATPLPHQRGNWLRWPAILLNWDFAPAWPRVAVFASCIAAGFVIGMAGLDTRIDEAAATSVASDLPSLTEDVEPLIGLRP